jgi:hypothetical protein
MKKREELKLIFKPSVNGINTKNVIQILVGKTIRKIFAEIR